MVVPDHPVEVIGEVLSLLTIKVTTMNKVTSPQLVFNKVKDPLQVNKVSNSNTAWVLNLIRLPDRCGV